MDEQIIVILQDLPDVLFENGERPNFRRGDLVRAWIEHKPYGAIAHVDYG